MPSRPASRKPRPAKRPAPEPDRWTPITAANLTDQVYSAIRAEIAAGRLRPGDPIREAEVAQALGVSRTPLREACARLASECFLERVPNRGYRIPAESPRELLNLYPIVSALEVLAAQSSLRELSAEDLANLRARNQEMKAAAKRRDWRTMFEANNQFHHELSARCDNERLTKLLDDLRAQVVRLEIWSAARPSHRERAWAEHEEIIDAVERRKYDSAIRLLEQNRMATYAGFMREVENND
jgi:DNA-binding GntR family transcriptional regulator